MSEYKTLEQKRKLYKSIQWKKLRQLALERDNHECQWCKKDGKVTHKDAAVLEIDHVKEIEYYPELAYDLENLRTLCKHHHNKRHNRFDGKESKESKWAYDEKW